MTRPPSRPPTSTIAADRRPGEAAVSLPAAADAGLFFIGTIRTPWRERRDCPRRGALDGPDCHIEVDPLWRDALHGLMPGATLQVLYWMHLAGRDLTRQRPTGREHAIGTFALRSPMRPNPIASSAVRLLALDGTVLTVRGLDCVDGTPLVDIKPDRCPAWGETAGAPT